MDMRVPAHADIAKMSSFILYIDGTSWGEKE